MIAQESNTLIFFLYFLGSCFVIFVSIFFCFSDKSCIIISYIFCNKPDKPEPNENTPLIMESEYFPRPGYDGYCIIAQENLSEPTLARGIRFSHSVDIDQTCDQDAGLEYPRSVFPKGILSQTPMERMRRDEREKYGDSVRSVSFNPQTFLKII